MSLSVINAAGKATLSVLRPLLTNIKANYTHVNLLDLFPAYPDQQRVLHFLDNTPDLSKFSVEKLFHKYPLLQTLEDSDTILYFTHCYYLNTTCKNEYMHKIAEVIGQAKQGGKKVVFVNLLEYAQSAEGKAYFTNAVETEKRVKDMLPDAQILWSELVYGESTEFLDFANSSENLPAISHNLHFTAASTLAATVQGLIEKPDDKGLHYLAPEITAKPSDVQPRLVGGSSSFTSGENILGQSLSTPTFRHCHRLWSQEHNLRQYLSDYATITPQPDTQSLDLSKYTAPTTKPSLLDRWLLH